MYLKTIKTSTNNISLWIKIIPTFVQTMCYETQRYLHLYS